MIWDSQSHKSASLRTSSGGRGELCDNGIVDEDVSGADTVALGDPVTQYSAWESPVHAHLPAAIRRKGCDPDHYYMYGVLSWEITDKCKEGIILTV